MMMGCLGRRRGVREAAVGVRCEVRRGEESGLQGVGCLLQESGPRGRGRVLSGGNETVGTRGARASGEARTLDPAWVMSEAESRCFSCRAPLFVLQFGWDWCCGAWSFSGRIGNGKVSQL